MTNIDRPLGPWIAPVMFALSGAIEQVKTNMSKMENFEYNLFHEFLE